MAKCTAPVNGHHTQSGRDNCPACGGRSSYRSYSSYTSPSYNSNYLSSSNKLSSGVSNNEQRKTRAKWSSITSSILYTPEEIQTLTPVRENVERRLEKPDLRDVFLCHAWDDRNDAAKELHDLLELKGVSVWLSEKDVLLGSSLMREIDKGLAKSRVGIVLVTPSFLNRIQGEGIADKELSALLHRDLLVPIIHNTSYEDLRDVSPLLGSKSGLSTKENSMDEIVAKLAELVAPELILN